MYESDNYKIQINWQGLIIKVALVVLAVLLIIWLFPMPKLDTFYSRVYNDNLNSMRTVAENYFVGDKLPSETGASTTLKLQDMLDKKIITEFVDKDNKSCNTTNSYAQVTKTSDNYVLKVQLACDEKTDYILENINTVSAKSSSSDKNKSSDSNDSNGNNDSDGNSNNSNKSGNSSDDADSDLYDKDVFSEYDKDGAITEYEYKRAITKASTTYTCPDGYVKENNVCYKYENGETIKATKLYFDDVEEVTKAKKNTTGEYTVTANPTKEVDKDEKVCPEGYTLNGDICYKYVNATVKPGTTTYKCEKGKLENNKCVIEATPTTKDGETIYSCKEGRLENNKCIIETSYLTKRNDGNTYYTCDNGGDLRGDRCYTVKYDYASKNCSSSESYYTCDLSGGNRQSSSSCSYQATGTPSTSCSSCPSGYSENGNTCVGYVYANLVDKSYWSNPVNRTYSSAQQTGTIGNLRRTYVNHSCTARACTYIYAESTRVASYACPSGYAQVGSTCAKADVKTRSCSTTTNYSCPYGGSRSGSTCYYQGTYHSGSTSCSCPSGYSEQNGSCVRKNESSYQATKHTTTGDTIYYCPNGYNQSGSGTSTKCTKTVDADKKTTDKEITCPSGYDKSGSGENTKCTKKVDATPVKGETQYTCPSGYVQKGTTCYTYTDATNKKTYKYSCPEGYDKSGEGENTKCSKTIKSTTTYYCEDKDARLVDDKCIKTIKGALKGYECPTGYIQNNDKCVKKTTVCMPAEVVTNNYTTYEYKWSTATSIDGWMRTGKTRTKGSTNTTTKKVTNDYDK